MQTAAPVLTVARSLFSDHLHACLQVRWHVTATRWHMMHLWERILADLGISWEYLEAETVG